MGDEDKQFDATTRKHKLPTKEANVLKSKDLSTPMSNLIII